MPEGRPPSISPKLWPVLLPLFALIPVAPLIAHGPSCGHDFGFHIQSWMDAAQQLRHGTLLPRWAFSPAFNAGEPRFLFYPPLSWLLGALLLLVLPANALPIVYTWLALCGATWGMYALARRYAGPPASAMAAALYIGNPYIFFTAIERTAYAELLAATFLPLLLRAALAAEPSVLALALPLALLWLTNAPAAVMGTYTLVLLLGARALFCWWQQRQTGTPAHLGAFLVQAIGGLALGLALPGFYLVPAAFERRYVQIAMAIIPNMRVEDNFLFGHTDYIPHNQVLHTASLIALELIALTLLALLLARFTMRRVPSPNARGVASPEARRVHVTWALLAMLAAIISVLVWHITLPLWHIVPELAFLQFPWRLMAVLGCVFGLAVALAARGLGDRTAFAVGVVWLVAGTTLATPILRQGCDVYDPPASRVQRFLTRHGVGPTDEYTPTNADNDQLRWDDPAFWLATDPNAPGPNTVPNPAATITDYDQPPPMDQTVSGLAPMHLQLHLARPEDLILNLRDYPAWAVTLNGHPDPSRLQRDDGLLALALPAGNDTVEIHWHTLPDMVAGDLLSALAGLLALFLAVRSRKIEA